MRVNNDFTAFLSSRILAITGMSTESSISFKLSSNLGLRILFIIMPAIGLPRCLASLAAFNVQERVG